MDQLEGKVAVVTGAGSGIGAGMARAFAGAGMSVVVADLDEAGMAATVADVEASVNDVGGNVTESADELMPIPVLAVRGGARFGGLHVEALVSGMTINYDGDDATYLEADLQAGLDLFGAAGALSGGVVAGYRYIALDVEYDDATESADLDLSFRGPYLGLSLSF